MHESKLLLIGNNTEIYRDINDKLKQNQSDIIITRLKDISYALKLIKTEQCYHLFISDRDPGLELYSEMRNNNCSAQGLLLTSKEYHISVDNYFSFSKNSKTLIDDLFDEINALIKHYDVFCSYTRKYSDDVVPVCSELKMMKKRPWLDQWEIKPGDEFEEEIEHQIKKIKKYFIFIGDNVGDFQKREIRQIIKQYEKNKNDKKVIPILLKSLKEKTPDSSLELNKHNHVDLRENYDDALEKLRKSLIA